MDALKRNVPPFSVTDVELSEIEEFCGRNGLDQIGLVCSELRSLRAAFLTQSKRLGIQAAMISDLQPDANKRFAAELSSLTGGSNAPPLT